MLDLAQNETEKPRMISDICKTQSLSPKYVSRLIVELRKAGMIYSVRGAGGGYKLKKEPKNITLLEIIETMEGPMSIVSCVMCPNKCKRSKECIAREVWGELNEKIKQSFEVLTLQDILERNAMESDYCI